MKNVKIDLYTALSLIKADTRSCVWISGNGKHRDTMTLDEIKNKFDMRHTYVSAILPCFICNEYEGMELILSDNA